MLTEQANPRTRNLDQLSALELVSVMNAEDATVAETVRNALPQVAQAVEQISEQLKQGGRLFYLGAGTSGRLGVLDAAECVPTFGTPPELVQALIAGGPTALLQAVEGAEDHFEQATPDLRARGFQPDDALIGIAASGSTPYVLGGLAFANSLGALTIGISCNEPAPVLEQAQLPIALPVGPEVLTGSTRLKAGTAQKMVLNMISTAVMVQLGKTFENLMVDVQVTNAKLARRARGIVEQVGQVDASAAERLLEAAGGHVKTALVMARLQVDAPQARILLEDVQGHLSQLLPR